MTKGLYLACAILTVVLAACGGKAKSGEKCKLEAKQVCEIKQAALVCQSGKWTPVKCRGPKGCVAVQGEGDCDQAIAEAGEVCVIESDHACTPDQKAVVACRKGKWAREAACGGAKGCQRAAKDVSCDNSIASPDDPCLVDKDYACAPDRKSSLVCKGGKFEASTLCRGPKGCAVAPGAIQCDDTVAEVGDACEKKANEDHFACSLDAKSVLKCDAAKFVVVEKCRAKDTCKITTEGTGCGP